MWGVGVDQGMCPLAAVRVECMLQKHGGGPRLTFSVHVTIWTAEKRLLLMTMNLRVCATWASRLSWTRCGEGVGQCEQ